MWRCGKDGSHGQRIPVRGPFIRDITGANPRRQSETKTLPQIYIGHVFREKPTDRNALSVATLRFGAYKVYPDERHKMFVMKTRNWVTAMPGFPLLPFALCLLTFDLLLRLLP